jgi:hypothetical protein
VWGEGGSRGALETGTEDGGMGVGEGTMHLGENQSVGNLCNSGGENASMAVCTKFPSFRATNVHKHHPQIPCHNLQTAMNYQTQLPNPYM